MEEQPVYTRQVGGSNPSTSTMRKQKNKILTCPECKGNGFFFAGGLIVDNKAVGPQATTVCYYCAGTGYQQDEDDSFEQFYKDR